jgi:beta-alanine degradation protein BauB
MTQTLPPASSIQHIDDPLVRVTEWRLAPGTATGWHRHEMPYVIVPTKGGKLRIATPDGDVAAEMVVGQPYSRPAGVEHDVINDSDGEIIFVEVEVKEAAGA